MIENLLQHSNLLLDNSKVKESYKFYLPTNAAQFDPIFIFTFKMTDKDLDKNFFYVALNSKLIERPLDNHLVKEYKFNTDGTFTFNNEEFEGYFIHGEIRLHKFSSMKSEKNCFVKITYGKNDEALHFIKGDFKLLKNTF